jgi:hypothetical protein
MAKKEERKIILSMMNSDRRNFFFRPIDTALVFPVMDFNRLIF